MDLDNLERFKQLDPDGMYEHIQSLPDQISAGWKLGLSQPLPAMKGIEAVVVAGVGGSAIGADLIIAYLTTKCPVPIVVHRDYGLPAWAKGAKTLVVASSHSGNTEETLSAFEAAQENGCQIVAISRGGKLEAAAQAAGVPFWRFEHNGAPRAAVGVSSSLFLALLFRLGLIADPGAELAAAVQAMKAQQAELAAEVPVAKNPAKRLAGQLMNRHIYVVGSDYMAPIARRWKGQFSEVAKAWAQFEFLPEADHSTLAGIFNPQEILARMMALFVVAESDHPRNKLRAELTRKKFMQEGINTDVYQAKGESPLAHIWTALHFGDYLSFYLAMAYGEDPTPIAAIESLKVEMKR